MQALLMQRRLLDAVDPSSVGDADGVRASILGTRRRRLLAPLGFGCDMMRVVVQNSRTRIDTGSVQPQSCPTVVRSHNRGR